jgi:hypothetical protein
MEERKNRWRGIGWMPGSKPFGHTGCMVTAQEGRINETKRKSQPLPFLFPSLSSRDPLSVP